MKLTWRGLNDKMHTLTEEEVLNYLNYERQTQKRVRFLERLHQRYTVLRASRERIELLNEAGKV